MGGTMFRNMMEKARNSPTPRYGMNTETQPQDQQIQQPQPPQTTNPQFDAQLQYYQAQMQAWQQQMQVFSQLAASNPEMAAKMTMPPPPPPPQMYPPQQPIASAPPQQPQEAKKIDVAELVKPPPGRNRDAYEISNSADVYFAQLKRDSTVRTLARRQGDVTKANAVFEDESVHALKDYLGTDLMKSRRDRNEAIGGEFTTSRDEMLIPYEEEEEVDKEYSDVS
jgi:hypothetical protein